LKRWRGKIGCFGIPEKSHTKQAMKRTPPRTIGAMTAAEFQGYEIPPQEIPTRNKVRPDVYKKIPRKSSSLNSYSQKNKREAT
jgi:hypothetical protein